MNAMVWKRCCAWLLCAAMALGILPGAGWAMESDEREKDYYCDEYGERHDLSDTVLVEDETWANNWYIVKGMVTLDKRVEVEGNVKLVLNDGATLTAPRGIHVAAGNSLTVYGQEQGNGKLLIKNVNGNRAGIGGDDKEATGHIMIYGGTFDVTGGFRAAGIGGGNRGIDGYIEIHGNSLINAYGGSTGGAGIGGGYGATGGNIVIKNCQNITAKGYHGAGIGGGMSAPPGDEDNKIVILDGDINAFGTTGSAGIGGGSGSTGGNIEIRGGEITASGDYGGAGIGAGMGGALGGNIIISGGKIIAQGSEREMNSDIIGSAGIGGGDMGPAGTITITGGEIHATGGAGDLPGDGIGNGGGYSGDNEQTSISISDANECPVIYTSFIADVDTSAWKGIIFQEDKGQVYGNVSLSRNLTIREDQTLIVPKNVTLTVPENITLTNHGTIDGTGTLLGKVEGRPTESTVDDGKVTITAQVSPEGGGSVTGGGNYAKGSQVTLAAKPEDGHHFSGWYENDAKIEDAKENYTFIADNDRTLTAKFEQHTSGADWNSDDTYHWKECIVCQATLDKAGHSGIATCTEYAFCDTCGQTHGELAAHEMTHHAAKAATCTESGMREYWHCRACAQNFADTAGTTVLEDLTILPLGHTLIYHDRVAPTYSANGLAAHYACETCGGLFLDAAAARETSRDALVIPRLEVPNDNPPVASAEIVETAHGHVNISPQHPRMGQMVTITVEPDSGYVLDTLIVRDHQGHKLALTTLDTHTFTYYQPAEKVVIEAVFQVNTAVPMLLPFDDVNDRDWFYTPVAWAYDNGLMTGTSATTFAPNTNTTRAMIVAILHRLENAPVSSDEAVFDDIPDDAWYIDAVHWAESVGIIAGYGAKQFGPNDDITREQVAAILCNYAAWKGMDTSADGDLSGYSDTTQISPWATDAVRWAAAEGLLKGVAKDLLAPQDPATRAQIAAILQRFLSA